MLIECISILPQVLPSWFNMAIAIKKVNGIDRASIRKLMGKQFSEEFFNNSLLSDANLLAYYRLEGNANDYKNSFNATAANITYGTSYGKFNQGALFNGSNSAIYSGNSGISGNAALSFSAWIKPSDVTFDYMAMVFIGNYDGALTGIGLGQGAPNGSIALDFGAGVLYESSSGVIANGNWYHIVGTKAAGAPSSTCKLYVNGSEVSGSGGGSTSPNITNAPIRIGHNYYSGGQHGFFSGSIDDVTVFNRVLTASEILSMYNSKIKKFNTVSNS